MFSSEAPRCLPAHPLTSAHVAASAAADASVPQPRRAARGLVGLRCFRRTLNGPTMERVDALQICGTIDTRLHDCLRRLIRDGDGRESDALSAAFVYLCAPLRKDGHVERSNGTFTHRRHAGRHAP